jgi:hypothetical protein
MKKAALIVALAISFVTLLPISWRLADPLFTHPFREDDLDPVLLACPDHVEIHRFHDLPNGSSAQLDAGCTFNIAPARQAWVENAVRALPAPGKASWQIRVKQVSAADQQIGLELLGDGISGMIYEARQNQIVPLSTRLTGPGGAFYPLAINVILWGAGWLMTTFVFRVWRKSQPRANASLLYPSSRSTE